jgi:hypothetical protein
MGYKKGQITFTNLIAVLMTLIIYFAFLPVLQPIIDATVADLDATTTYGQLTISLMYLTPFVILLSIILTAINYANPRREGYYGGGGY